MSHNQSHTTECLVLQSPITAPHPPLGTLLKSVQVATLSSQISSCGGQLTAGISSASHPGTCRLGAGRPRSPPAEPCRNQPANASSSSSTASQSDIVQSSSDSIFDAPDPARQPTLRPVGLLWRRRTCHLRRGLENKCRRSLRFQAFASCVIEPPPPPPYAPRFGRCSFSGLSGGHDTLQPHDPCLSVCFSVSLRLSLSPSHTHRERSCSRCPLVTPANKSFIIMPVAFSFFFLPAYPAW